MLVDIQSSTGITVGATEATAVKTVANGDTLVEAASPIDVTDVANDATGVKTVFTDEDTVADTSTPGLVNREMVADGI